MNEVIAKLQSVCNGISGNVRYLVNGDAIVTLYYPSDFMSGEQVDAIENALGMYFSEFALDSLSATREYGKCILLVYHCSPSNDLSETY